MGLERRLVASAFDDVLAMAGWRLLARRRRTALLYFQLRAEGATWRRARTIVHRLRRAIPEVRRQPLARDVALDLILA